MAMETQLHSWQAIHGQVGSPFLKVFQKHVYMYNIYIYIYIYRDDFLLA